MCSSGTRAQYEVKRVQNMKKIDRYKMALRTELHLSEPGFSGLSRFSGLAISRVSAEDPVRLENRTYRVGDIYIKGVRRGSGFESFSDSL